MRKRTRKDLECILTYVEEITIRGWDREGVVLEIIVVGCQL